MDKCNFRDEQYRCMLKTKDGIIGTTLAECDGKSNCILFKNLEKR